MQSLSAFLRWYFSGMSAGGISAGLRLVAFGLLLGFAVGWSYGMVYHIVRIEEKALPRPVLPPPAGQRWVPILTTGYCPCPLCCGVFASGHTAINRDVKKFPFGLAVAPSLIPYRATLDVPGYGAAMVDDTGGAMRQDAAQGVVHLDLRFETHTQAKKWGRKTMWIAMPDAFPAARLPAVAAAE